MKKGKKKKFIRIWSFMNVEGYNLLIDINRYKLFQLYIVTDVFYWWDGLLFQKIPLSSFPCEMLYQVIVIRTCSLNTGSFVANLNRDNLLTSGYFLINICPEVSPYLECHMVVIWSKLWLIIQKMTKNKQCYLLT